MNEHTSLEISKQLHEKGFKGEHAQAYADFSEFEEGWILGEKGNPDGMPEIPAYTLGLWGVLPHEIKPFGTKCIMSAKRANVLLSDVGYTYGDEFNFTYFSHESLTEAIALLLIWLIENGHMEVSK